MSMNGFPYWSKSLPSSNEMFQELKRQDIVVTDNVLERKYPEDYMKCDHISNHFTEYERILCQFGNYPTPANIWSEIKNNIKDMSPLDQREFIYSQTKECNTFNVTFCLWIIRSLVGSNAIILDPSAGWGDRLIAALANDAKVYHGFDPNKKLQKGYKNIIKTLNENTKVSIKCLPFEDTKLKNNYYDLALTSPPYFDLEKYGTDNNQSIIRNPNYKDWLQFYKQYIIKMVNAVKQGGFIVIYIENITSNGTRYDLKNYTVHVIESTNLVTYHTEFGLSIGRSTRWAIVWSRN